MKPYRLGRSNGPRWRKIILSLVVFTLVIAAAGYFGTRYLYERNLMPVDAAMTEDVPYTIRTGATSLQIAEELEAKGLIRSARAFNQYVRVNDLAGSFKAGTYRLKKSMSGQEIAELLTSGQVAEDLFTILPGYSLDQIRADFIEKGFSSAEIDSALDPANYSGHPALADKPAGASLEGFLYPDSYHLIKGTTKAATIIGQSLDEMAAVLTAEMKAKFKERGLSVYDALKLASIVEGEVSGNNPEDRPQVAQVFLSRLEIGMMLQSNATDYAASVRGNAYDTYQISGLPPEPISNVTSSALEAVADPAGTDFLYFVSGRDCVTRFSRNEAEHNSLIGQHGVARPEDNCT